MQKTVSEDDLSGEDIAQQPEADADVTHAAAAQEDARKLREQVPLKFCLDPGDAPTEVVQDVLEKLSDLNVAQGGLGLEFEIDGLFVRAREKEGVLS